MKSLRIASNDESLDIRGTYCVGWRLGCEFSWSQVRSVTTEQNVSSQSNDLSALRFLQIAYADLVAVIIPRSVVHAMQIKGKVEPVKKVIRGVPVAVAIWYVPAA